MKDKIRKYIRLFEEYEIPLYNNYKIAQGDNNRRVFRWFEICFYEANNKRHSPITKYQYSLLSEESKKYLMAILEVVKRFDSNYSRTGRLLDRQTNLPLETGYDFISYLASCFFSGFGRGSVLGSSNEIKEGVNLLMPPSQEVVDNIDYVFRKIKS
jgi:hypothetical protein